MMRAPAVSIVVLALATAVLSVEPEFLNNPLGVCKCDGELWIAADCKSGFKCVGSERKRIIYFRPNPSLLPALLF